jgi:hypothetical protein
MMMRESTKAQSEGKKVDAVTQAPRHGRFFLSPNGQESTGQNPEE